MPDIFFLNKTFEVAKRSMDNGNLPFGCILVNAKGEIIEEGENTVITDKDSIAHCEINLTHQLAGKYDWQYLNQSIVYASTEPCPMCTAAILWSGIGKLVYALGKEGYHTVADTTNPDHLFEMSSKKLLEHGGRKIEVIGPLTEEESKLIYKK